MILYHFSNIALCYSKLELHRKVLNYSEAAIRIDPLQSRAYLYKGKFYCDYDRPGITTLKSF